MSNTPYRDILFQTFMSRLTQIVLMKNNYTNDSRERENKLIEALNKFAACFESLKADVAEIKSDIDDMKGK